MADKVLPKAKFDKKGRVVCPTCGDRATVPLDSWLSVGQMVCGNGHAFFITAEVAVSINDILSRTREGDWRKDVVKNAEEIPDAAKPLEEDGKIIIPRPTEG